MIFYIINAALILTGCFVFYKLLLQKETFFPLNRFVLLGCLAVSFSLPLLPIPAKFSFQAVSQVGNIATDVQQLSGSVDRVPEVNKLEIVSSPTPTVHMPWYANFPFKRVLIWGYWTGVLIFGINFFIQLATLLYRAYTSPVIRDGRFRIVEISGDKAPCSFGNNIFINPEKYEWETYSQILLHEKVHIEQGHSYDIMIAEIALVFQWFNPFAWMYRKAIEDNLEFLTDNELLEKRNVEPSSYQLSLVKVSAPHFPLTLTTNYNQSILKKRLLMMNAKKSTVSTAWKYLFILPLMLVFACLLNDPIAYAASSNKPVIQNMAGIDNISTEGYWFATIKKDRVVFRFETKEVDDNNNSNSFSLDECRNLPINGEGSFSISRDAGTLTCTGKFDGAIGMGKYNFNPDTRYANDLENEGVRLTDNSEQFLFYLLNVRRDYVDMLKEQGFTNVKKENLIPLAALKIDEAYIKSIASAGIDNLTLENLIPLKALNIDAAYIKGIKKATTESISPDRLITLKSQGIDGEYLESNREAKLTNADFKGNVPNITSGAISNRISGIDKGEKLEKSEKPEKAERENSDGDDGLGDLIARKILGVSKDFIKGFEDIGYNLTSENQFTLKSIGVTPEYVKAIEAAGFTKPDIDDLTGAKALGITPEMVRAYKNLSLKNLTLGTIMGAAATGTSPEYIRSMKKKGYNYDDIEKYISRKTLSYIVGDN